jgi:DHA1 family multidrug resistance protein-like MFS transporter
MILVQFLMMTGFSSMAPFLPFFVGELGIARQEEVRLWAGVLASVSALFAALFSPLWGSLADRLGRKLMVVRSCLAAGTAIFLVGFAHNVYQVLILRTLQGVFGGYSGAAIALVASEAPVERLGWALGLLQTGQTLGLLVGPTLGGAIADHLSYRAVFMTNGLLAFGAGLITLISVSETSVPAKAAAHGPFWASIRKGLAQPAIGNMFLVLFLAQFAIRSVEPVLSLYIRELEPDHALLGTLTGTIFAVTGLAQVVGLFLAGRYSQRLGPRTLLLICIPACALLYFPQALVHSAWQLLILRAALGLFLGSIVPMANTVVGQLAPAEAKGSVFGFTSAALFLGGFTGPLVGGTLAAYLGLRFVFVFTACLFLVNFLWSYRSLPSASLPQGIERRQPWDCEQ